MKIIVRLFCLLFISMISSTTYSYPIVQVSGAVTLKFYTAINATDPSTGSNVDLAAGIQKEILASEFGTESNNFLMVYNSSETTEGGWEVVEGD